MDNSLQNHGFGDIESVQESSGVPIGVDEADMILGAETTSTLNLPPDQVEPDAVPKAQLKDRPGLPARPNLRRDKSVPAPHQPPPPAPPQPQLNNNGLEDSLSLSQMKRIVHELPKADPTPYAFVYRDAGILPEELEEWFSYSAEDRNMITATRTLFADAWSRFDGRGYLGHVSYLSGEFDWTAANATKKRDFIRHTLEGLNATEVSKRMNHLGALAYVVLGCWHETAGGVVPKTEADNAATLDGISALEDWRSTHTHSSRQLQEIRDNVVVFIDAGGLDLVYEVLRNAAWRECAMAPLSEERNPNFRELERSELWASMTILYFCLEVVRCYPEPQWKLEARARFFRLQPDLLIFMSEVMDKIRWDDTIELSVTRLLLLFWKTILVMFGGSPEANEAKASFEDPDLETSDSKGYPIITASPLDYHLFRQEISSKYPAYSPPPPLFALEPENNSILPPLKPSLAKMSDMNAPGLANLQGHGTSILNQPVHIATPAPSPPPSPAVGGKGGKKQNYQTNQLFPFLYPPLDETSNNLGGKGSTDLQDLLVGRKWEGSDIPASILEAAELFAKRMRAPRAMKQLWGERVEFMKYERGWKAPEEGSAKGFDLTAGDGNSQKPASAPPTLDGSIDDRLRAVESFYRNGLPHLQSVVMVLLKVILSNVTALITQMNGQNGLQSGFQFQDGQNGTGSNRSEGLNGTNGVHNPVAPTSADELDATRNQEINAKVVSGILITLLKWFKASHILQFEYLTQLLVDANYIPLILKLMQTQEVERLINYRCDYEELNFFHYCRANSRSGIPDPSPIAPDDETSYIHQSSSEDEAAPPPIKRHRSPPKTEPPPPPLPGTAGIGAAGNRPAATPLGPEVDELGIPTTALPMTPITTFSWRNFYSTITLLRILRKVCARHAHRNLLLVSYKSTPLLRRALRVPQPELRKYALKLVKAQVPFCGRKWRQANMRVITAVWLSIRPELRDEWLAGGDVDGMVEESVPREQAIRGLVHWWHMQKYWDVVGPPATLEEALADTAEADARRSQGTARTMEERKKWLEEENDFFRRELERMEWNWGTGEESLDEADREQAQHAQGHVWDAGVPVETW